MKSLLKIVATGILLVATVACAPGLNPNNPVPAPNPDHGAGAGPEREVRFEVHAYDALDHEVARPITVNITAQDAAGRPANLSDPITGAMTKSIQISGSKIRTPLLYSITALPGVVRVVFTCFVQGYGGDSATLEITNALDDLMPLEKEIEFGKIGMGVNTGVITLGADVIMP